MLDLVYRPFRLSFSLQLRYHDRPSAISRNDPSQTSFGKRFFDQVSVDGRGSKHTFDREETFIPGTENTNLPRDWESRYRERISPSLRIATETSNFQTSPLSLSRLSRNLRVSVLFLLLLLFLSLPFFSLAPRKKARPSFASFVFIKQRVQDSISLRAVFARKNNFRRWTRGGGRGSFVRNSRFVPSCQREHFFVFFTSLVSLIYPVILEPCGTIRTFVRLPELVHPLDEKKERNKVLARSSFTATYCKQGAGLGSGNIPRNIPSSIARFESLAKQRL